MAEPPQTPPEPQHGEPAPDSWLPADSWVLRSDDVRPPAASGPAAVPPPLGSLPPPRSTGRPFLSLQDAAALGALPRPPSPPAIPAVSPGAEPGADAELADEAPGFAAEPPVQRDPTDLPSLGSDALAALFDEPEPLVAPRERRAGPPAVVAPPPLAEPGAPPLRAPRPPRRSGPAIAFAEPVVPGGEPLTSSVAEHVQSSPDGPGLLAWIEARSGQRADLQLPLPAGPRRDGPPPLPLPPRYSWLAPLGEGGQGSVELVFDRDLGRAVALKTLHAHKADDRRLLELYREVRITGQLAHPQIIAIHDVGRLPDGRLYYTMPRMPGESLHTVLARLRRGDAELVRRWTQLALVQVIQRACQAVGYAHERGVIHRDLKPANLLLGTHGEVYVVDWGIARLLSASEAAAPHEHRLWSEAGDPRRERIRGSPPYMAPEQVQHPDQVTAAADVFCLGVILYEALTRVAPWTGPTVDDIVDGLCHERPVPPRERAPEMAIPSELEEICLRCLEKFPGHRYASGSELATALQDWVAGGRRRESAARRLREAESMRSRHRALEERCRDDAERFRAAQGEVGLGSSSALGLRAQRERLDSLRRASESLFAEAAWALHRALLDDPDNAEAQRQLGELYALRYTEAERDGDEREAAFFRALLRQLDDGRWGRWLRTGARLELALLPEGRSMALHRLDEQDGVLQPGERIEPEAGGAWELAPGRYALIPEPAAPAGARPSWYYPIRLHRGERLRAEIDLRGEDQVGEAFCFVPGGPASIGGDSAAPGSAAEARTVLPPFALARHPVTVGAWARFLDALATQRPAEARRRTPPDWDALRRSGERRPMRGIGRDDAEGYCTWISALCGARIRLPSADEWEKAVRGADARPYPWGDRWDSGRCASLDLGAPAGPAPEVGSFADDRSPFGLCDAAGGVWDWTASSAGGRAIAVGGSIAGDAPSCRAAARRALDPATRLPFLGFRVLMELTP
jgi:serine/threonine-protein kinase